MSIRTTLFVIIVATISLIVAQRFEEIEIILSNQFYQPNRRNAIKKEEFKWPNGVIPFTFEKDWTCPEKKKILKARKIFNRETCVSFVRKTEAHQNYIIFVKSPHRCASMIGYTNQTNPIPVFLSDRCLNQRGLIQHEMLHVIGLTHEQCRSDRDDYINILWENIREKYLHDFAKVSETTYETFNLTYDYNSLLHYGGNACAKKGRNVTITSKLTGEMVVGQKIEPTFSDLEKVRRMYKCV